MLIVLAVLILAETGIHGIVSITDNGTANRDIYVESEQEVCGLLESAGVDQVDYRAAIVNPLVRNEEMLYQLNGISMYSSTNTEEMWDFVKNMGFENLENRFQYAGSTEVTDMLLGIRYLFCRNTRKNTARTPAVSRSPKIFPLLIPTTIQKPSSAISPAKILPVLSFSTFPHASQDIFKSGNIWGLLLTAGVLAVFFLVMWTERCICGKLSGHAFCCVEIRKLGCLVLAVLILAETGIHGIVSITEIGRASCRERVSSTV